MIGVWGLLLSCLVVPGDRILTDDLAAGLPDLASLPPGQVVGYAPAPGARRQFSPGDLSRIATRFQVAADPAKGICVERRMTTLDQANVRQAMLQSLEPTAQLAMLETSRFPIPYGEVQFPKSGLLVAPGDPSTGVWRGFVRYDGNRRFPVWARVRVTRTCRVLVAVRDLASGTIVAPSDWTEESRTCDPTRPPESLSLSDAVGKALRRSLRKGAVLQSNLLIIPPVVRRGDTVRVEARQGAVVLQIEAKAETVGRIGDRIVVRNPLTGKRFPARVESKEKVVSESSTH